MNEINRDELEPLAEGLDALPEGAFDLPRAPEELRAAVLERTSRIVRGRARRRRLLVLTLAAAAYLAGITTAFLLTETAATSGNGLPGGNGGAVVESRGGTAGDPAGDPEADPADLERQAGSSSPEERVRLLTRAGDLYLAAQCDVERALACYRRALDAMPAVNRTAAEPDDSWLLAALKDSRR